MALKDIQFSNAQGEEKTLKDYTAKAYLVVNVASKCGLTPHYEGLQKIYSEYHGKGLEILAFPSNDFLGQEPGSDEEIQSFCQTNFNVTFPVNKKITVKGSDKHPFYAALLDSNVSAQKKEGSKFEDLLRDKGLLKGEENQIHWNFEKFLLNDKGEVVARFFPDVEATDKLITDKIEKLLA